MSRWLQVLIAAVVVAMVGGCGSKPEAPPEQAKPKAAAPKKAVEPPAAAAAPQEAPYNYDPLNRRDPFEVPFAFRKTVPESEAEQLTPLQKFDVGQLRLIGVIVGKGEPRALVVAPDGKSYILTKGIKVGKNEGVVIEIRPQSVSVKERFEDFAGEVTYSVVEIELPKREGV